MTRSTPGGDVEFTHLDKTLWPEDGLTKGDLIAYLQAVGSVMLPHFRDRPVTFLMLHGDIHERPFYRREIPDSAPSDFRHITYATASNRHEIELPLIDDVDAACWYANAGAVEFHLWASRAPRLDQPDLVIFDLDSAEESGFPRTLEAATLLHRELASLGLESYAKTSGGQGLHVYLPLAPGAAFESVREWVGSVATRLVGAHPGLFALAHGGTHAAGRVTIDAAQNSIGRNTAAPYTPRARIGAPVSTPLSWDEVDAGTVRPGYFTVKTVPDRVAKFGDVMADVLAQGQRLPPIEP